MKPDERTRRTINGYDVVYLIGDPHGGYEVTDPDGRTLIVYPSARTTTAMRGILIRGQLAAPDPLFAALGALLAADGALPESVEVVRRSGT